MNFITYDVSCIKVCLREELTLKSWSCYMEHVKYIITITLIVNKF